MKKIYVLLLAIFPIMVMAQDKKKTDSRITPNVDSKIFVINGDNAWLKTDFVLKSSDKVTIKATGDIRFSNGESYSQVGPNGYGRDAFEQDFIAEDFAYCIDPMEDENHAALIGKDKQGTFLIGENETLSGKSGILSIGINDCSFKTKYYNTGKFNVSIKIIRGK